MKFHGNIRQRACAVAYFRQRACAVFAALVAAFSFSLMAGGAEFSRQANQAASPNSSGVYYSTIKRDAIIVATAPIYGLQVYLKQSNGSYGWVNRPIYAAGGSHTISNDARQNVSWSGLSSTNASVEGDAPESAWTLQFRLSSVASAQTVSVPMPASPVTVVWSSNTGTYVEFAHQPLVVTVNPETGEVSVDDPVAPPDVKLGECRLLLENTTGIDQEIDWNGRDIILKPGMNELRYTGPVGENGAPSTVPEGFDGVFFGGSNGVPPYLYGVLEGVTSDSGEFGNQLSWRPTPGQPQVLGLGDGVTRGVTIFFPSNAEGTAGSIVTLPPSRPPVPPTTAPGGTGGTGTITNPNDPPPDPTDPGTGGGGGGDPPPTGGNVTNNTTIINNETDEDGPPPIDGSSDLRGLPGEGEEKANELKSALNGTTEKAKGFWDFGFWNGSGTLGGDDRSWLNFQLPIASQTVTIEVEESWVSVIRQVLLWGLKISFVWAVVKLFLK